MQDETNKTKKTSKSKNRILTTSDIVFKMVFSSLGNEDIIIGFINDVLELDVKSITIENTYNIRSIYNDDTEQSDIRFTQVDVLIRIDDGSLIVIEMQAYRQLRYIERSARYFRR